MERALSDCERKRWRRQPDSEVPRGNLGLPTSGSSRAYTSVGVSGVPHRSQTAGVECCKARDGEFDIGVCTSGSGASGGDWHLTPRSLHADGKKFLLTALAITTNALHLEHVACVRACRVVHVMFVLSKFVSCEVLVWLGGAHTDEVALYTPEVGDLGKQSPAKTLAFEVCEVDRASASWTEVCFVQFLSVRAADCRLAIKAAPQTPLFASVGGAPLQEFHSETHEACGAGYCAYDAPHSFASTGRILDVQT